MRGDRSRLVRRSPTVPAGPNESSPVRSAGLAFRKPARPGRDDRQLLAVVKPHPSDQEPTFRSSLAGRPSSLLVLPALRTGLLSIGPLRDRRSPWHLLRRVFEKDVHFLNASATPVLLNRFLPISHKRPSEELQFHQFRDSFRILTFLTRRLALAVEGKEWIPRNDKSSRVIRNGNDQNPRTAYLCMREKPSHFEEAVLPHLDRAYNLARWLIENDQDAQVIVQEAYRQAQQEFGTLREADPQNWLLTIVRKRVHAWIQGGEKHSKVIPPTFPGESSTATQHRAHTLRRPLLEGAGQEWKQPLYEALSRLPVEFREVLVLREIEGWNYTQLASALGIPRTMVGYRLSIARERLRQELKEAHRRE
jgi:RNA polymerase sigma-70 factor, ECF subfamily